MLALDHADAALKVGTLTALGIYSAVILLLLSILLLRVLRLAKERRRQAVTETWRPLLAQCVVEVPETVPPLKPRDHIVFLYLWNHCYESIQGEARAQLIELARRMDTDQVAKQLLHNRRLRRRLLAIVTLGHLQERSAWDELAVILESDNAFLSLVTAKALLNIDAQAAIPLLIPVISRRHDWSPLKVVAMFDAVDPGLAAETIAIAASQAHPQIAARLIRHLAATQSPQGLPPSGHSYNEARHRTIYWPRACFSSENVVTRGMSRPFVRTSFIQPGMCVFKRPRRSARSVSRKMKRF